MSEVLKFKNALLARSVIARVKEAFEHTSPEAMQEYLKAHPHADPKNHWVKKPGEGGGEGDSKSNVPKSPKPFFDSKEVEHLPENAKQPVDTKEGVYEAAKEALAHQVKWLNQGQGLDKAIGAKVIRKDQGSEEGIDYDKPGPVIIIGSLKSEKRASEKVEDDYDGHWNGLGDIVRASVALDSFDEIGGVLDKLKASGLKLAKKPKDRFVKPTNVGYRDLMMNVTYPNGHIGELQLHVKEMLKAKDTAHKDYEVTRSIEGKAKVRNQKAGKSKKAPLEFTPEEQKTIDEHEKKQRDIYEAAWQNIVGGTKTKTASGNPMEKKSLTGNIKFYDVEGLPGMKEGNKSPMLLTVGGSRPMTHWELWTKASEISKEEFEKLKSANKIK